MRANTDQVSLASMRPKQRDSHITRILFPLPGIYQAVAGSGV